MALSQQQSSRSLTAYASDPAVPGERPGKRDMTRSYNLVADDTPFGGREVRMASGTVRFEEGSDEEDQLEARGDEVATTAEAKEGGRRGPEPQGHWWGLDEMR
ncbi:hypothetical protein PCANC_00148 [Puccinia coronata f. sp. avenae]|uniref:Uncharacterized protein n=1 Tax=Puccinia coronata f. sp. avenae TaxID=200324 RepID=A0A2N5W8J2_9BASI|nr:hypothetical protein PCANC_00148 [Puccinia coronata f. sp. avenae]